MNDLSVLTGADDRCSPLFLLREFTMPESEFSHLMQQLGALQADVSELKHQHRNRSMKAEAMNTSIHKLTSTIERLSEQMSEMRPVVNDWQRIRQRGIGAIIVIGVLAGAAGSSIINFLREFFTGL